MGMIDTTDWGTFKLGKLLDLKSGKTTGTGLFNIVNSVAYHGKDITETYDGDPNGINYVTRSKFNNGVKCQVVDTGLYTVNPAGTISFGAENADFFYQTQPYITGNKMYYIDTSNISDYACAFVKSVLEKTFTDNFSFTDGMIPARIYDEDIKLPVDANGNPDWQYMEDYMKSIEVSVCNSLSKLASAKDTEKKQIDVSGWGKYHLYDIFDISMGNKFDRSKMNETIDDVNFVGRSAFNNGVACTVSFVNDNNGNKVEPYKAGDITIAMGGSIGSSFIQQRDFYTSQNVCVLHTDNPLITYKVKQFIISSIYISCANYEAFVDELNRHIKTDFVLYLPTLNGQPDWAYMEQYMRNIETKAIQTLDSLAS